MVGFPVSFLVWIQVGFPVKFPVGFPEGVAAAAELVLAGQFGPGEAGGAVRAHVLRVQQPAVRQQLVRPAEHHAAHRAAHLPAMPVPSSAVVATRQ